MTRSVRQALARAAFVSLLVLAAAPLFAQSPTDAVPFSADPKALLAAAQKVDAKEQSVVYLLEEATFSFEADGRSKSVWHEIKSAVTTDGVDETGTVVASWAPWYDEKPAIAARVIAKDGTVHTLDPKAIVEATAEQEEDIFSDQRVLRAPLPGVAAGSVVETVITMEGRSPIAGGGTTGRYHFGAGVDVEHTRLILDSAAGVTPRIVNKTSLQPRTVVENGRTRVTFEQGHSAAVETAESYLPFDELNVPYVAFSSGTSWQEIAKNYSRIVDQQIGSEELKSVVAAATGKATDRREVIGRLLDTVNRDVRYAGVEVGEGSIVPRPPKSVLQKKYGDCKDKATLLVALLRTAGIPAHVALLEASTGFDTVADLPGITHFNHAIVAVDGEPALWVDPTDEFARPGELPIPDQGRMALIASETTTALTRTPEATAAANRYIEARTLTLPEDGKAHVVEVTEGTWIEDAQLRRTAATTEKKDYRESLEKYAMSYFVAPKLDRYEMGDPHNFGDHFRLTLDVPSSKNGIVDNGEADVAIPVSDIVSSLPQELRDYEEKTAEAEQAKPEKKRVHDFVLPRPSTREWRYRIVPAPGFEARTLPKNDIVKLGTASLTTEYSTDAGGAILAKLTFDSGKRRLTAAEYEETRIAVSKLARRTSIHVGFDSIGQARLNAGDVGAALTEFRKLSNQHPKEAQHHIELARALLAGGLGDAARDEARRAIATEPGNAKAHAMLATVLEHDLLGRQLRHGCDLHGAIAALRKAKELDPTKVTYRARLADLLVYGDDDFKFGKNAHLAESIDEYKSLLKELGNEAANSRPPLMLALAHAGRWDEVKELDKAETQIQQRDLFQILATTATEGSAAGLRELGAFDLSKRRSYGAAVAGTLMALRRYGDAADFFEAATKGSDKAAQTLATVQVLRKVRLYEKAIDNTPRSMLLRLLEAEFLNEPNSLKALIAPEILAASDETHSQFSMHALTGGGDSTPTMLLDLSTATFEVQQDGDDESGYRLRMRASAGTATPYSSLAIFVVRRDGRYLVAGFGTAPASLGMEALKLADDGKVELARTWLNWARELVPAGGGDEPLTGSPFARMWPKEKASATLDEVRLAAAVLAAGKESAAKTEPILEAMRDKATTDETKTAVDLALVTDYEGAHDWAKLLPVSERLSRAYPDSGVALNSWTTALTMLGKSADAEAIVKERLARRPKDEGAMRAMITIAAKEGDYESAVKWARRVVDEVTPTENDYNEAAWVALFRGTDLDRAIDDARRATSDERNASAAALHTLAALYAESGKSAEARQALLKSIERRYSEDPTSSDWFVLGRIAENYGIHDAAVAAYKRVDKEEVSGLSTWELARKRMAVVGMK